MKQHLFKNICLLFNKKVLNTNTSWTELHSCTERFIFCVCQTLETLKTFLPYLFLCLYILDKVLGEKLG